MLPSSVFLIAMLLGATLRMADRSAPKHLDPPDQQQMTAETDRRSVKEEPLSPLEVFRSQCAAADGETILHLAQTLHADPIRSRDAGLWSVLLDRWVRLSAVEALAFARTSTLNLSPTQTLEVLVWQAWADADPNSALAAASTKLALTAVWETLARSDPDKVLAHLDTLGAEDVDLHSILQVLTHQRPEQAARLAVERDWRSVRDAAAAWGAQDPVAAWRWALDETSGFSKRAASVGVMTAWVKADPAAANAALAKMPASRSRAFILAHAGYALTRRSSASETIAWIENLAGGGERAHAFADIARRLASAQPQEAKRFLDALDWDPDAVPDIDHYRIGNTSSSGQNVNLRRVIHDVVEATFREDPEKGLAAIGTVDHESLRAGLFDEYLGKWVGQDAEAPRQWVAKIDDPSLREKATFGYGQALARAQPDSLDDTLQSLDPSNEPRIAFAEGAARSLALDDSQAALDWLAHHLPTEEVAQIQRGLIDYWQEHQHRLAFKHVDLLDDDPEVINAFLDKLGGNWGNDDPEQMAAFLSSQPEPNARWCGFAAFCWMGDDPEAASRWAASLPQGEARDEASANVSQRLYDSVEHRDFEAALAWAQAISGPEKRETTLQRLGAAWWRVDPEGAAQSVPDHRPDPDVSPDSDGVSIMIPQP